MSTKSLRILLSGANGFIGSHLYAFLLGEGHEVIKLSRHHNPNEESIVWNPETGEVKKEEFEDFDAVIHLAGKNIAARRWSKKVKEQLFTSRCRDSWLLSQVLLRLYRPPATLICASAVGYYGDRPGEALTEESAPGIGFLPDLCKKWEQATAAIEERGVRTIHTRFGAVLHPSGGLLKKSIPFFRLGLGTRIGSGDQIFSWVALEDLIGSIYHLLLRKDLSGPFNICAPEAVSHKEFVDELAKRLHSKVRLHISAPIARVLLGEMADALFLASCKAVPEKLLKSEYQFLYPSLKPYLQEVI